MENYILAFRAPLKVLLQRQQIFEKLNKEYPEVRSISIDMDDKQYVINMVSPSRIENEIQNTLLSYGFRVAFLKSTELDTPKTHIKTA